MSYTYKIIERDVNGCGEDAEMFIESFDMLDPNEVVDLQNILKEVKTNSEDSDTEDMVEEACELFNGSHLTQIQTVPIPYILEIEF